MNDLEYEALGELLDVCETLDPEKTGRIRMKLMSGRLVRKMQARPERVSFGQRLRELQPLLLIVTLMLILAINLIGVDVSTLLKGLW